MHKSDTYCYGKSDDEDSAYCFYYNVGWALPSPSRCRRSKAKTAVGHGKIKASEVVPEASDTSISFVSL